MATKTTLAEIMTEALHRSASDIHIIPGYYPSIRVHEELYALRSGDPITGETSENLLIPILTAQQKQVLEADRNLDFAFSMSNRRFRANYYYTKGSLAATFRIIAENIKSITELRLPEIFNSFAKLQSGLVLITGPTGEGKSTTLASVINEINTKQSKHIITIEDPIEHVYPIAKSIVSQRENLSDTHSFADALRGVLREDPDVVLVGEMRDLETTAAALTIAETGHLVFSTLHTSSTAEAINRIVDIFPSHQQNMVRNQLSSVLRAIVAQRLIPTISGDGRVPVVEVLLNNSGVANSIRDGKTHLIDNMIATSADQGMILFEKDLARAYHDGSISKDMGFRYAFRPNEFDKFIK